MKKAVSDQRSAVSQEKLMNVKLRPRLLYPVYLVGGANPHDYDDFQQFIFC